MKIPLADLGFTASKNVFTRFTIQLNRAWNLPADESHWVSINGLMLVSIPSNEPTTSFSGSLKQATFPTCAYSGLYTPATNVIPSSTAGARSSSTAGVQSSTGGAKSSSTGPTIQSSSTGGRSSSTGARSSSSSTSTGRSGSSTGSVVSSSTGGGGGDSSTGTVAPSDHAVRITFRLTKSRSQLTDEWSNEFIQYVARVLEIPTDRLQIVAIESTQTNTTAVSFIISPSTSESIDHTATSASESFLAQLGNSGSELMSSPSMATAEAASGISERAVQCSNGSYGVCGEEEGSSSAGMLELYILIPIIVGGVILIGGVAFLCIRWRRQKKSVNTI